MKEKKVIVMNKEIEALMKGFKAVFGDDRDLHIVRDYTKIREKLKEVDSKKFRELAAAKKEKELTSKMKEIRRFEDTLIATLLIRADEKKKEFEDLVNNL